MLEFEIGALFLLLHSIKIFLLCESLVVLDVLPCRHETLHFGLGSAGTDLSLAHS